MSRSIRILTILVVFGLMFSVAGCGSITSDNSGAAVSTAQGEAGSTQQVEQPAKNVLLKWYTDTDDATNELKKFPEFVAAYEKENPGVTVELAPLVANTDYSEYLKKADLMLASGEQMDLVRTTALEEVATRAKSGVLMPLDDYAAKEGIKLEDEYNGIIPIDGKVYAIPDEVTRWLVFINKDLLDAANLPMPPRDWTWADYREYAKKLTKGEGANKVYGSYMHTWDWFNAIGMQSKIMDKSYITKDGKQNFDNPVFKDGLVFRHDLEQVDKSQMPYPDMIAQKTAYRSVFFSGKAAMLPMGAWMCADFQLTDQYPHTFRTTFATFPRWDNDCKANTTVLDGAGSGWSVNAGSKNTDEAYKFLRALTTEGFATANKQFSPWKKVDSDTLLKTITGGDEKLYDLQALKEVLYDPDRVDNVYTYSIPGESEVTDAWVEESQKYLVGGQTVDQAIANTEKRAEEALANAKK